MVDTFMLGLFATFRVAEQSKSEIMLVHQVEPRFFSDTNYYDKRMSQALSLDQQGIKTGRVVIGRDAFIGLNSVVLPGVEVEEGAVIGANSLVNKNIPAWSIAVGSPARVIKMRKKHNLPDI